MTRPKREAKPTPKAAAATKPDEPVIKRQRGRPKKNAFVSRCSSFLHFLSEDGLNQDPSKIHEKEVAATKAAGRLEAPKVSFAFL